MKKLIFLLCCLPAIALVPDLASSQQVQTVLKIIKSDDGTVKLFDPQGNEIKASSTPAGEPAPVQIPSIQKGHAIVANPAILQPNPQKKAQTATTEILNPGPDLRSIFQYVYFPYPNLHLESYIENIGTAPSGACYLGYFLSTDQTIGSDILFGQELVNPLNPGEFQIISRITDLSLHPGTWWLLQKIDNTNMVSEDDESNNSYFHQFFSIQVPGPNLIIGSAGWGGFPGHFSVTIINMGTVSAGSSVVGFYLSEDAYFSTSDHKLGDLPVFPLPPGAESLKSINVSDVCNYVPSGIWYVGAVVDETNAVAETDETDNTWTYGVPFRIDGCCSITVTHPNGGEVWVEGSTQVIRWTSVNTSGNVKISASLDGGASWIILATNIPDNRSASWVVPDVDSDRPHCRIKIEDVVLPYGSDISDADFTIRNVDYSLTIDVNPPGSGSVDKDPNKTNYDREESVQLTANATPGYRFDHWSGDLSGNDNPVNLIMNDDKSISAVFVSNAYTNPYQVTNTNDIGPGSLRQALANAALNPNPVPIVFSIPKSDPGYRSEDDVWTIKPATVYYIDRSHLTIDGASQAEYLGLPKNSPPKIELDGSLAPDGNGIYFNANDCGLNGMIINNFVNAGISFSFLDQGYVYNCYIGTDATGSIARGNGTGIHIIHASNIVVAPVDSTLRGSIISGNTTGISIQDTSYKAIILRNIIGSDRSITKKIGNSLHGICLQNSCAEVVIAHNVLTDNGYGIYDQTGFNNTIAFNYIGTDTLNGTDMGNKNDGIYIGSTMDMCYGNTIAYNHGFGLLLTGESHTSNTFSKNSIYRNHAGGIDLRYGANSEIKPPQILSITMNSVSGVTGANQFVEVFVDSLDQGRYFLGTTTADQDGKFILHLDQWPYDLPVTATTRDEFGSTSKFSAPCVMSNVATTEDHPEEFIVSRAYPNPFNMSTSLQITLSCEEQTIVQIFNYQGKKVRDLLSQRLQQGTHQINWQGTDNAGKTLSSGIYYILCKIGTLQESRKTILLK